MFEDIYKQILIEVNNRNQCVMLTYLDLHSARQGSIVRKVILTKEDIEKSLFHLMTIFTKKYVVV